MIINKEEIILMYLPCRSLCLIFPQNRRKKKPFPYSRTTTWVINAFFPSKIYLMCKNAFRLQYHVATQTAHFSGEPDLATTDKPSPLKMQSWCQSLTELEIYDQRHHRKQLARLQHQAMTNAPCNESCRLIFVSSNTCASWGQILITLKWLESI